MDGPPGWTPRRSAGAGLAALLLVGAYALGQAVCPEGDPPFTVRGVVDDTIIRDCLARGDVIVLVLDPALVTGREGEGSAPNEFACAASASLESLAVRAK
jgi:hypothetical protein